MNDEASDPRVGKVGPDGDGDGAGGAAIAVRGLGFAYSHSTFSLAVPFLDVAPGAALAMIGPSGSGKTTLLNLVAGILLPDAGSVEVDGTAVHALSAAARRRFRIRRIGLVFQEFELVEYLSVLDNVLLPYRISAALSLTLEVRDRAVELIAGMGLGDKGRRNVRQLSQGERQRVAIARALLPRPAVLLCDEPTGNLDPDNKGHALDVLLRCASDEGRTLLTVTHDHDILDRFDRVLDIRDFGVRGDGPELSA